MLFVFIGWLMPGMACRQQLVFSRLLAAFSVWQVSVDAIAEMDGIGVVKGPGRVGNAVNQRTFSRHRVRANRMKVNIDRAVGTQNSGMTTHTQIRFQGSRFPLCIGHSKLQRIQFTGFQNWPGLSIQSMVEPSCSLTLAPGFPHTTMSLSR